IYSLRRRDQHRNMDEHVTKNRIGHGSNRLCSQIKKRKGHHECEILSGGLESEAAECGALWRNCTKNPGHEEFM
ncbi:hypothetical protein RRG08_051509, partial [Elysia crispata]